MCDDFPPDGAAAYRPQAGAVEAIWASTLNISLSRFGVEGCDALDQRPVESVFEDDHIPRFETIQKEGDSGKYHEVPFLKVGRHGVAGDFMNAEQF